MRRLDFAMNVHTDHADAVLDVDYSPTGKEFVSGSYDRFEQWRMCLNSMRVQFAGLYYFCDIGAHSLIDPVSLSCT